MWFTEILYRFHFSVYRKYNKTVWMCIWKRHHHIIIRLFSRMIRIMLFHIISVLQTSFVSCLTVSDVQRQILKMFNNKVDCRLIWNFPNFLLYIIVRWKFKIRLFFPKLIHQIEKFFFRLYIKATYHTHIGICWFQKLISVKHRNFVWFFARHNRSLAYFLKFNKCNKACIWIMSIVHFYRLFVHIYDRFFISDKNTVLNPFIKIIFRSCKCIFFSCIAFKLFTWKQTHRIVFALVIKRILIFFCHIIIRRRNDWAKIVNFIRIISVSSERFYISHKSITNPFFH